MLLHGLRRIGGKRPAPAAAQPIIPDDSKPPETPLPKASPRPSKILEVAAFLCLVAGAVGIFKALRMEQVTDVLICLGGSLAACMLVCYFYFQE